MRQRAECVAISHPPARIVAINSVQRPIERRHGDYAFHTMLLGKIVHERLCEPAEAGHALVKMFTTDITPSRRGRMLDFGDIWEALKVLRGRHHRRRIPAGKMPEEIRIRPAQ